MKSPNTSRNAGENTKDHFSAYVPEEGGKNEPPLAEIRQRAFEIHIERGGIHGCDLEDWLEAERELKEKYNRSNGEGLKSK